MKAAERTAVRRMLFAAELFIAAILNAAVGVMPELYGGRPLVAVAAALSVAACEKPAASVIFGAVGSVAADLQFSGKIGFYSFAVALCCYAVPSLMQSRFKPNHATALLLIFFSVAAIIAARYIFFVFELGVFDSAVLFVRHGISKTVLTFACAVPLYFFNRKIIGGEE